MRGLTPPARERIQPHAQATPVQATVEHSPEANTGRILLRAESDLPPECGRVRSPLLRKLAYLSDRWLLLDWLFVFFVAGLVGIVDQIEPWHKPLNELQLADVNINLPYLPSIISDALVICLSIVMPPLIMLLLVYPCRRHHRGSLSELRIALLAFFTAVVFNLLVTTITKKYVGRPRPNFVEYTGKQTCTTKRGVGYAQANRRTTNRTRVCVRIIAPVRHEPPLRLDARGGRG